MKSAVHLLIEPVSLKPGEEWSGVPGVWNFVHVTAGAAYWLGASRTRALVEGEMVVVSPRGGGLVRASQIGAVTLHAFAFSPDLLCGFFTMAERHCLENQGAGVLKDIQFLPSTHPATLRFAALIVAGLHPGSLLERIEVLGLVAATFDPELARYHAPAAPAATALHRFNQLVAKMPDAEIIHHTPEQLAHLCGCSPRHFNRLFRDRFGASARAHQTTLRLLKARHLLSDGNARIVQVALESGYRNLSLFNSLFKRRFGTTPSAWRRQAVQAKADG